jgi:hypothetical protein
METRPPEYDYPVCTGGAPPARLGDLESVTLRYKRGNDTFEVQIDAEEAKKIGGVLWDPEFIARVTGPGPGNMSRHCRGPGQARPVKVVQARQGGGAEDESEEESAEPFQELGIDSGNCYYHHGMIICC